MVIPGTLEIDLNAGNGGEAWPGMPGQVVIRPMQVEDVPRVTEIEALAHDHAWPRGTFLYDLTHASSARYFVAELQGTGLSTMSLAASIDNPMAGFCGTQLLADELHVLTLAVHRQVQRRRIGERLLAHALVDGLAAGAVLATLEVRVSNAPARSLYLKYGFQVVGGRRAYYADNHEDALIMTVPDLADEAWQAMFADRRADLAP